MEKPQKTSVRAQKYVFVGIILTIFNFLIYSLFVNLIIKNNDFLWIASAISYTLATFLAYFLHSKITWKERHPDKTSIIKFFLWNFITALIISPTFTWLFTLLSPLYNLLFNLSSILSLSFSHDFIESTGVFVLVTLITMILNYTFYDRLVFGKTPAAPAKPTMPKVTPTAKVSIIIPIYNTEKYLKSCLDSIINQTYQNLEIILIDDGSTDGSKKIADTYAKKDPRIKVIHQKNQGQSAARNAGLKKATGDYISFIDSDDKIKPTFIAELLAPFSTKDTALSVCGIHYKRLKQNSAKDVYLTPLRQKNRHESNAAYILYLLTLDGRMYSSVNKLYLAKIAKTLKFDESLNFAEDTKFVLSYLKKAPGSINFVLRPLYIYNFGTESSTISHTATDWKNWQTSYNFLKSWLGKHKTPQEFFWLHLVHLRWRISYLRSSRRGNANS